MEPEDNEPNYRRNRIILATVLGGGAAAFAVAAIVQSLDHENDGDQVTTTLYTTTTNTVLPPFPTTTSAPFIPDDELLKELNDGTPTLTLSEFNAIKTGTTEQAFLAKWKDSCTKSVEQEVAGITGSIYECSGSGGPGANANFQFQNGRLIGKAQVGLTD